MAAMRSIAGAGAMARLPLLLLLAAMSRAYIPPDGPDLNTAAITEVGQYPGVHADLLATSLRLLEADGRSAAAETYADPHDLAALHDGLRQASTGAGEFGIELYNSVGVAMRNTLSHFYNPETREGRTCAIPDAPAAARHAPVRARLVPLWSGFPDSVRHHAPDICRSCVPADGRGVRGAQP